MKDSLNKNMYKMGVIGGMGSKSTSYFLGEIFRKTDAKNDQEHINLICLNHASLVDRTELINKSESEPLVSDLLNDMKILNDLGVKFISIPCNTVFHFMGEINDRLKKENINIEILSIVDTCTKFINEKFNNKNIKTDKLKVGILATDGTIKSDIYKTAFSKYDIEVIYLDEIDQGKVQKIIYEDVKSGSESNSENMFNLIDRMREHYKCDIVVLGCTELSFMRRELYIPDYCVDALDALVDMSILKSDKTIKLEI